MNYTFGKYPDWWSENNTHAPIKSVTTVFTIFFEDPFWVGVFERTYDDMYEVCKYTFGAEPTNNDVIDLLVNHWDTLKFSVPIKIDKAHEKREISYKTAMRKAKKQVEHAGIGTKAQQALKLQQEETKKERKHLSKEQIQEEKDRKYLLRQEHKREKHKGR